MVGVVTILRWGRLYRKANPTPLHHGPMIGRSAQGQKNAMPTPSGPYSGMRNRDRRKKKTPALRPAAQDLKKGLL